MRVWPSRLAPAALAGGASVALAVYGLCGWFVRYFADDHCFAASVKDYGWVAAQGHWYETWSGRFSATALSTLATLLGPGFVDVLSGLLIASLALAAWLAMRYVAGLDRVPALAMGAVATYAVIRTAPDVTESAFWLSGECAYMPPMILMPIVAVAIARRGESRSWRWLLPIGLIALISAGFSETAAALQVAGFGLLAVCAFVPGSPNGVRYSRPGLLAAFLGSAAGTALVVMAPGNAMRQAYYPPHPPLLIAISSSLTLAWQFVAALVVDNVDVVALVVLGAALVGFASGSAGNRPPVSGPGWAHLGWTAWAGALIVMCFLPAYWSESLPPPNRTLITACAILVGWATCAGLWLGRRLASTQNLRSSPNAASKDRSMRSRLVPASVLPAAFAALAILPLITAGTILRHLPSLADWSRQSDVLQVQLTAVEGSHGDFVVAWSPAQRIRPLKYDDSRLPGSDPTNWVNVCLADEYGLKSVTVVSR